MASLSSALMSFRLCEKVQVLSDKHRRRQRQALVELEEDLLQDRGTQLVRDLHRLHDPAQQRCSGR